MTKLLKYYLDTHHSQKNTKFRIEIDHIAITENKLLLSVLLSCQHDVDLLGGY